MAKPIKLSVHDTVPVWVGETAAQALSRSLDLAKAVEDFGYQRYWVAEHHSTPALATSAPAVLAASILGATNSIRVGSGAVLLPNHSALGIAEQFGVLASLHSDRVDLGIGRGVGGAPDAAARLNVQRKDFGQQFAELSEYFSKRGVGVRGVRSIPEPTVPPQFWLVGSSVGSAVTAGQLGVPYVYAHSIVPGPAPEALAAYRQAFTPSEHLAEPYGAVAAIVVATDSDERAHRLADAFVLGQIRMRTTDPSGLLPTEDEAAAHRYAPAEDAFRRERKDPQFIGTPQTIAPALQELLAASGADELMALTQVPDHAARIRSYELLAKVVAGL